MKGFRIFTKLFFSHAGIGLITIVLLAVILDALMERSLIRRTMDQLSAINILKQHMVRSYLRKSEEGLEALNAGGTFRRYFHSLSGFDSTIASRSKDLEEILEVSDLGKLAVLDSSHRVLYSMFESDFTQDIKLSVDSMLTARPEEIHILDASSYSVQRVPQLLYVVPVVEDSVLLGYLLIEENLAVIHEILLDSTGMGVSGESYLVGADYRMRSRSRFFPDKPPLDIQVRTGAARQAMSATSGTDIIQDYRGVRVLSAFMPMFEKDLEWVVISEIDHEEALEPIVAFRFYMIVITLAMMIITLVVTYFISSSISRPIVEMRNIINSLSKGILPRRKPVFIGADEIGDISRSIGQLIDGMTHSVRFAHEIGSGNFGTDYQLLSDQDALGQSLLSMRDQLREFNEREIRRVRDRSAALMEGQEQERRRIIQELHDGVGQLLIAVKMRTELIEGNEELKKELYTHINEIIGEVRRISYNVMPNSIVDYGLEAALKGLCENVQRYASLPIEFTYLREIEAPLNFDISIAVFRIVQEGLNNVVKHAKAQHVKLDVLEKQDELYLLLEDDGRGFDEENHNPVQGLGLQSMRERAQILNGTLEISSQPGQGTAVELRIPLTHEHGANKIITS